MPEAMYELFVNVFWQGWKSGLLIGASFGVMITLAICSIYARVRLAHAAKKSPR